MNEPTLFERLERRVAEQMKLQNIICPACGEVYCDGESLSGHVTYWGEDEPQEFECPECETLLMVDEQVTREFHVSVRKTKVKE